MPHSGNVLDVSTSLDVTCVGCGTDRPLPEQGERIVSDGETGLLVVRADEPCECGERRVRIKVRVEIE